jgi:L-ascorbate metabolism protein UlaG (beta-lactamase superfamily)
MTRSFSFVAAMLILASFGAPLQSDENTWKPIQITWHGQSFFEIKSSKGTNIVIDPHMIPIYGRIEGVKADAVLITHNHNDHTQIDAIENARDKNVKIIPGLKPGGMRAGWNQVDEQIKDVHVRSLGVYHDNEEGMRFGKNTIFIIDVDGWHVVHLGDLGHMLSPEQIRKIGPVDVLMIPVGGIYTINGSDAKKVVEQLKPREYIFPMHCGTKIYDELLPPDEFLEDQPRANVSVSLDNKVTLNRDPQRPRPLIVQLNFWPRGKKD